MTPVYSCAIVGFGGFLGSISRWLAGKAVSHLLPGIFPTGTLAVNISGCFLIGVISYIAANLKFAEADTLRLFLGVGFLGAFTTFSAFEYETMAMVDSGRSYIAAIYVSSSVILGYAAVRLGLTTGRVLLKTIA